MHAGPLRSTHLWDSVPYTFYPLFCEGEVPFPKSKGDALFDHPNIGQLLANELYTATPVQVFVGFSLLRVD